MKVSNEYRDLLLRRWVQTRDANSEIILKPVEASGINRVQGEQAKKKRKRQGQSPALVISPNGQAGEEEPVRGLSRPCNGGERALSRLSNHRFEVALSNHRLKG